MRPARRVLILALILALTLAPMHDVSGQVREETTLAMLDFDLSGVEGSSEESGALVAELVAIELSRASSLHVLERARLADLLREQSLELSGETDSRRALSSGRMLGARFLVSGRAFSWGGKVTITVNLVSTATGHVKSIVYEGEGDRSWSETAVALASRIQDALGIKTEFEPSTAASDTVSLPTGEHRGKRPRIRVLIKETLVGGCSRRLVAENQLSYRLLEREFEVFTAGSDGSTRASRLEDVDVFISGEVKVVPGLRTGDLISATAELRLEIQSAHTDGKVQTVEARSRALGVSVESAARGALRRVADEAMTKVLPGLVESAR